MQTIKYFPPSIEKKNILSNLVDFTGWYRYSRRVYFCEQNMMALAPSALIKRRQNIIGHGQ